MLFTIITPYNYAVSEIISLFILVFAQVTYAGSLILLLILWAQNYILFTINKYRVWGSLIQDHIPRGPVTKAQEQTNSSSLEKECSHWQYYQQEAATLKLEAKCKGNRLCLKAELVLSGCNLMECLYCIASERGPVKHCGRKEGLVPVLPLLGPLDWR